MRLALRHACARDGLAALDGGAAGKEKGCFQAALFHVVKRVTRRRCLAGARVRVRASVRRRRAGPCPACCIPVAGRGSGPGTGGLRRLARGWAGAAQRVWELPQAAAQAKGRRRVRAPWRAWARLPGGCLAAGFCGAQGGQPAGREPWRQAFRRQAQGPALHRRLGWRFRRLLAKVRRCRQVQVCLARLRLQAPGWVRVREQVFVRREQARAAEGAWLLPGRRLAGQGRAPRCGRRTAA